MTSKRFDLASTSFLESRDGGVSKGGLVRNGFSEVDGAGERWNNLRPALTSGLAGTLSGMGLVTLSSFPLFGVVGGSSGAFIGTWNPGGGAFAQGSATSVPGFPAILGGFLYKLDVEAQVAYRAPLATSLVFSTLGTTTAFSENSRADVTQTDSHIVAGMGFTGVYDYLATTDGLTWETVDSGFSVRGGNIVGYGAGVYRFDGNAAPIRSEDASYTYYTPGGTAGWNQATGTQASAFGTLFMANPCLSTAAGNVWAIGTATWTGGTSAIIMVGTLGGSTFTWNLVGTFGTLGTGGLLGVSFQKRFAWSPQAERVAFTPLSGSSFYSISTTGVISTAGPASFLGSLGALGGTLSYTFSRTQISRFNIGGGGGGFSP